MDLLTLQMAKNYTDETAEGMGIQKGKNCQIQSIEDITGGHRITFAWYDEDQVLQTDTVDIMDGPEGPEGPQGPQGEVGESGVGFGPVPEVMPEGVNWWIDPNGEPNTAATINDTNVSEDETWSSKKISGKFGSNNIWDDVEEAGIINTSTGEDEESTNGRRMPHDKGIAVTPGDTYYIKKTTTAKIRYTFYAADGTYIGNTDALGNSLVDSDVMSQKMVPPAGAAQFRAFASSSMVNAGLTVPTGLEVELENLEEKVDNLPNPMVLKGTLGTGGTITDLPSATEDNHGYTYKVITAGTYAGISADVGDMFSSIGTEWVHIPSGNEAVWTYGTTDIGVGAPLATGTFYAVYQ